MKPSEILKAAKAKIATPDTWTTGAYARDSAGREVGSYSKDAHCFCSVGAIRAVTGGYGAEHDSAYHLLQIAAGEHVPCFNDRKTHAEVMAKWDEAIALAEKDEANAS